MKKPQSKVSDPHWDYSEVIDWIEKKYKIDIRSYTPKCGFTEAQYEEAKRYGRAAPRCDFWSYIIDLNDNIHNGSYLYMNLLGDYHEGKKENEGDWDDDDEFRPRWVREIQKMIYDEFKPEDGEMKFWVEW